MSDDGTTGPIPQVWLYGSGNWVYVPDPLHRPGRSGRDEGLSEAGFLPVGEWFGSSPAVQVFERQTGSESEWRIELALSAGLSSHFIVVRQLPDLLDVLAKLAVIATADERGQNIAHGVQVTYPFTGAPD
jgi:hypothetical protein